MSEMLDEPAVSGALRLAARGIPVFPCMHTKVPYTPQGFHDATTDEAQIRAWWERWPTALIGMPTGQASGIVSIDLDVREGYDGNDAWSNLIAQHGPAPDTVEVLTPSGGRHIWFRAPSAPIRNSASKLGLGIDVRGEGGYVVVPPSRLPDGRRYEYEASSRGIADMPAWLVRLLGAPPERASVAEARPDGAGEGSRNQYLASYVGRLAHAGLSRAQIREAALAENARACSPPLSADEIDRTVMKSASKWVLTGTHEAAPESPEEVRGLRWYQDAEWLESMTAPRWLIRDYLEAASLAVTIGGWGSGKSLVELDRALRVVHGMPWQGIQCETDGVWVYVVGEAQRGFQRRVAAWHQHHGVEPCGRLIVIPEAVLMGNPDYEIAMRYTLDDIQQRTGRPVIGTTLDTMARCFGLESENDNSDVAKWVNSIQAHIVEPTGGCVSVLHHPGHGDKTRGRGGSALPGAADTEWLVSKEGNAVVLSCNKNKDGDLPPLRAWRVFGVDLHIGGQTVSAPCAAEQDAPTRPVVKRSTKQAGALEMLQELYALHSAHLGGGGTPRVLKEDWLQACLEEGIAATRKDFNGYVVELERKHQIKTDGAFVLVV